jgi:hypothetical protein
MDSSLKGLFGGGDAASAPKTTREAKAAAKDFVSRYEDGDPSEGYSDEEASAYFRTVMRNATPEQLQRATQHAMTKMSPDQRSAFAEMLKQRQAGQGSVQIRQAGEGGAAAGGSGGADAGGGGGLDDLLGSLMGGGSGGGGLGGLLGGLLGGGAATGAASGGGGGGLDDLLGGLMGGGQASAQAGVQQGGGDQEAGAMDALSGFLGSTAGKAAIAGVAAFALKELLDKD